MSPRRTKALGVRVPCEMVDRIDEAALALVKRGATVCRNDVVKAVLENGLETIERELGIRKAA
ncbi:MAG: hypothetical protein U0271_34185 [Polyangiaceae bacterium]